MSNILSRPVRLILSSAVVFFAVFYFLDSNYQEQKINKVPKKDRIDLAWAHEFEMTKDPAIGRVPTERLFAGVSYARQQYANKGSDIIADIQWVALGPKNFGGRTRALLVDVSDPTGKTIWAGSVGGGLWKTTNITAAEPNWTPIDDLFGNLAVTSIAQDPINPQVMYFGTGEGYGNSDAIRGLGIWKTSDGGLNWSQLPSTNNSTYFYVKKVFVASTGVLFAATNSGLQRSTNGGTSFTKVLGTGLSITGASSNTCFDIEETSNGDLYASISGSMHKSTNGGISWGPALPIGLTASRIEIATAATNSNVLYAVVASGNAVNGIVQSLDGGFSFTTKSKPNDADPGISASDFSRGQAWYDLTIAVAPDNSNVVYVGGIDLFKSTDGCISWSQIAHWYGGFGFQDVHADQHNIIFAPGNSNIVYFTNDGAIYRTQNGNDAMPTISYKSTNFNTLQYYACAMTPTAGSFQFVAGAQDNGSHKYTQPTLGNTTEVTGGDGAFCHIDQDEPQYWFTSYVYNNYYRSSNGGTSFSSASHGNTGRFINPTDYDDLGNKMYCARGSNEYLRWENPQTGSTFTIVACPELGGTVSAVKVSPNTPNRVFFGTGNGKVVRVDDANSTSINAVNINNFSFMPSSYISSIDVQPGNDNHILVTFSNYGVQSIWRTTDGGANWINIEGNLPDMPVRWIIFNPVNYNKALIATELGVWTTDNMNGSSITWSPSNNGLANVRVDMLQSRSSDKMIIAATHGRGLYLTAAFSPAAAGFTTSSQVVYPGRTVEFTNTSFNATSYSWNFGNGQTSTQINPAHIFNVPGTYNVSLSINGGASTVTKTIIVMPFSGTPYTLTAGGNFESNPSHFVAETISGTGWDRGSSTRPGKTGTNSGSNAWVTGLTATNYTNNSIAYLYGPSFNLGAPGSYEISFYTKYLFEKDYDGFRVEFSVDSGKTWAPIGSSVTTNWYNFANTTGVTAFPLGQAFFSDTSGSFKKMQYDISFLAGQSKVAIRFVFKSDGAVTAAGAAIDDLEITGTTNSALPLQLLSFTAVNKDRDGYLEWYTTNEVNVSHFEIERSWNGDHFARIGSTKAMNGPANTYTYKDALSTLASKPSNTTFYRLKMIDKDGKYKYSHIARLKWNDLEKMNVSISPNPFTNYLQVTTTLQIMQVQLFDLDGRMVYNTSSFNNGRLNIPALPGGTYIIKLNTTEGVISRKLVRQ